MLGSLAAACLAALVAADAPAGFAPEPEAPSPSFRGDFRAAWALTDGAGMLDHAVLEVDIGVQVIPSVIGKPAPAILFGAAGGIAESAEPSLRIVGGVELPIRVHPAIEVVPAFFGGFLKLFRGDSREGPMFRGALGLRVLGPDGFFVTVEPISITVLPVPPAGPAPYTDHFAWEIALIKIGGRTP